MTTKIIEICVKCRYEIDTSKVDLDDEFRFEDDYYQIVVNNHLFVPAIGLESVTDDIVINKYDDLKANGITYIETLDSYATYAND